MKSGTDAADIGQYFDLEHDPESGNRFSEKIMLNQRDEIMI
jgi:hypothetical protein